MWAYYMHITFGQLVHIGPSRAWQDAIQDYHMSPHNILFSRRNKPLHGPIAYAQHLDAWLALAHEGNGGLLCGTIAWAHIIFC
jgi:hypothetical protein